MILTKSKKDERILISAFGVSQGIVVDKQYYILEFSFMDINTCLIGYLKHKFFIESPFSHTELTSRYPKVRINVTVNPPFYRSYDFVLQFLRERYRKLRILYPNRRLVFAYKGNKHQSKIFHDAGIKDVFNIELLGIPSLSWLTYLYPSEKKMCGQHPKRVKQCTERTMRLIFRFVMEHKDFLFENAKQIGLKINH